MDPGRGADSYWPWVGFLDSVLLYAEAVPMDAVADYLAQDEPGIGWAQAGSSTR